MGSTYKIISIICFALAGLMLTVGIILFFTLKIRVVIGYLTGKTEKKSIAMMVVSYMTYMNNSENL